jgi:hypothetical protein
MPGPNLTGAASATANICQARLIVKAVIEQHAPADGRGLHELVQLVIG